MSSLVCLRLHMGRSTESATKYIYNLSTKSKRFHMCFIFLYVAYIALNIPYGDAKGCFVMYIYADENRREYANHIRIYSAFLYICD